jgi:hypothetical protein
MLLPIFKDLIETEPAAASIPKPVAVPKPVDSTPLKRAPGRLKSPSIKDALSGKQDNEKVSAVDQHKAFTTVSETNTFNNDALGQKWNEFLTRLDDRPNLQSTLSRIPRIENEYKLVLEIDNSVQEDLISNIKPDLVVFLRKELRNSQIQLITKITETEKGKVIYTDSEKYLEMLKQNPNLELLKQKFKLDFE